MTDLTNYKFQVSLHKSVATALHKIHFPNYSLQHRRHGSSQDTPSKLQLATPSPQAIPTTLHMTLVKYRVTACPPGLKKCSHNLQIANHTSQARIHDLCTPRNSFHFSHSDSQVKRHGSPRGSYNLQLTNYTSQSRYHVPTTR